MLHSALLHNSSPKHGCAPIVDVFVVPNHNGGLTHVIFISLTSLAHSSRTSTHSLPLPLFLPLALIAASSLAPHVPQYTFVQTALTRSIPTSISIVPPAHLLHPDPFCGSSRRTCRAAPKLSAFLSYACTKRKSLGCSATQIGEVTLSLSDSLIRFATVSSAF